MRLVLLAVFIVFPLLEIALLVKLGSVFGFWPTFGIVVGTAVLGSSVLHHQGFAVLRRGQEALAAGRPPIEPVVDGVFLLISGLFLITPGLITDSIGILLLIPPLRRMIAKWSFGKLLANGTMSGSVFTQTRETGWGNRSPASGPAHDPRRSASPKSGGPVIDGEFERLDERTPEPRQRPPNPSE
jgi:UPF0716 protein FxsA